MLKDSGLDPTPRNFDASSNDPCKEMIRTTDAAISSQFERTESPCAKYLAASTSVRMLYAMPLELLLRKRHAVITRVTLVLQNRSTCFLEIACFGRALGVMPTNECRGGHDVCRGF